MHVPLVVERLGDRFKLLSIQLLIYFCTILSNASKTDTFVDAQVNKFVWYYS